MSGVDWSGILRLPDAALAGGRRIPKAVLVKQAMLTKTEQKRLDKVVRLEHFATVQKSTTRIPPYEDDERNVQSIVFLRCEMAPGTMAVAEVAELMHKCFPNPTVLLIEAGGRACVSVALTRKSQAEQGATVVDRIEATGAFDPGRSEYAEFLGALAFVRLSQGDLWEYLLDMVRVVALSRAIGGLGFYPSCPAQDREKLIVLTARYDELGASVKRLRERRWSKDITLNESAKLRMEMKEEERRLRAVTDEIREICNG
ncbi:hypothetical protein HMPREF1978_00534 [Actinomyces graevenitzii F0530]|uniref:DUF4391 domain-containing protein n=1 Tax=Actinomyces graevenitzii F0530 TaxID=1321817 RepID=U1RFX5_9ACTO|nr:DUF4391 domain-containing protein [Actinomyces graevenitzii]ERH17372.1 hypothetical protein HMPREF1978_00534 [Actinomyces graevenitzii F0530]